MTPPKKQIAPLKHLLARRTARVVGARNLEHLEMVRPPICLMLERTIVAACGPEFNSRLASAILC